MHYKLRLCLLIFIGISLLSVGMTLTVIGIQHIDKAKSLTDAEVATKEKVATFSDLVKQFALDFGLRYYDTPSSSTSDKPEMIPANSAVYMGYILTSQLTPATIGDSGVVKEVSEVPLNIAGWAEEAKSTDYPELAFPTAPKSYVLSTFVSSAAILNTTATTNPSGMAEPIVFSLKKGANAPSTTTFGRSNIPFTKPNVTATAYCPLSNATSAPNYGCTAAAMEAYCASRFSQSPSVAYAGAGCVNGGSKLTSEGGKGTIAAAEESGVPCGECLYTGYLSSYCVVIKAITNSVNNAEEEGEGPATFRADPHRAALSPMGDAAAAGNDTTSTTAITTATESSAPATTAATEASTTTAAPTTTTTAAASTTTTAEAQTTAATSADGTTDATAPIPTTTTATTTLKPATTTEAPPAPTTGETASTSAPSSTTTTTPAPLPPVPPYQFVEDASMPSCHYPFYLPDSNNNKNSNNNNSEPFYSNQNDLELQRYLLPYKPDSVLFQVVLSTDPSISLQKVTDGASNFGPDFPLPATKTVNARWKSDDKAVGLLIAGIILLLCGIVSCLVAAVIFRQKDTFHSFAYRPSSSSNVKASSLSEKVGTDDTPLIK